MAVSALARLARAFSLRREVFAMRGGKEVRAERMPPFWIAVLLDNKGTEQRLPTSYPDANAAEQIARAIYGYVTQARGGYGIRVLDDAQASMFEKNILLDYLKLPEIRST